MTIHDFQLDIAKSPNRADTIASLSRLRSCCAVCFTAIV